MSEMLYIEPYEKECEMLTGYIEWRKMNPNPSISDVFSRFQHAFESAEMDDGSSDGLCWPFEIPIEDADVLIKDMELAAQEIAKSDVRNSLIWAGQSQGAGKLVSDSLAWM